MRCDHKIEVIYLSIFVRKIYPLKSIKEENKHTTNKDKL